MFWYRFAEIVPAYLSSIKKANTLSMVQRVHVTAYYRMSEPLTSSPSKVMTRLDLQRSLSRAPQGS